MIVYNKKIYKYDVINSNGISIWTIYANRIDVITEMETILRIVYPAYVELIDNYRKDNPNSRSPIHYHKV